MKKKAQAFVQDIVISIMIIIMLIMIYFTLYSNQDYESDLSYQNLLIETKIISDYLMSQGYPADWNTSNAARIGITNGDNVLNMTKLDNFYNLSNSSYDKTKDLLRTRYDYIVFFKDYDNNIINMSGHTYFGKPGENETTVEDGDATHLSKISRYVIEKQGTVNISARIIEMKIYVWTNQR